MNSKLIKHLLRTGLPIHIMQPGTDEIKLNVKVVKLFAHTFCADHNGITYGYGYAHAHTAIVNETGVTLVFL